MRATGKAIGSGRYGLINMLYDKAKFHCTDSYQF